MRADPAVRGLAALVALGCLAGLVVASTLEPAEEGVGTHTALGLPACGWQTSASMPCPTCGMTTAFAYAAEGRFLASFIAQPFAAIMAIAAAVVFWGGMHVAVTGSNLSTLLRPLLAPRTVWVALLLGLGAWGYKFLTTMPA